MEVQHGFKIYKKTCKYYFIIFNGGGGNNDDTVEIINSFKSTDKQEAARLLEQKKFTVSSPDVDMAVYEKGNGVLIQGNNSCITESRFIFEEETDFGTQSPGYIIVDAVANKKKNMELLFYLDDEKEHFASVKLNPIKRKNYWNYTRNTSGCISGRKINGRHKVSFKVVTDDMDNVNIIQNVMAKFPLKYQKAINLNIQIKNRSRVHISLNISGEEATQHGTQRRNLISLSFPKVQISLAWERTRTGCFLPTIMIHLCYVINLLTGLAVKWEWNIPRSVYLQMLL